jgi:predicted transcriptional regulator
LAVTRRAPRGLSTTEHVFGYLIKRSRQESAMGRAEEETVEILRENGEAYQSDLVRATGFSRATMSEVLASLARKRVIRRAREGRNSRVVYAGGRRRAGGRLRLGFTRAAEYPFLVPLRRLMREDGIELEFRVYENGVGVARDLSLERIEMGVAPLVTLFIMHSLDAPFKIIGPAGAGGSSVLESPKGRPARRGGARAVCTRMSTMEMLIRSAESQRSIPELATLAYADSPSQIERAVMSGSADLCSVWEPYATMLEARGARRVVRYSELSEHVCCVAAAGSHLGDRLLSRLSKRYSESMWAFKRDRGAFTAAYAALSGLDSSTMRRVAGEYSYPAELSTRSVVRQLQAAGLSLPSPSSFTDALFRA